MVEVKVGEVRKTINVQGHKKVKENRERWTKDATTSSVTMADRQSGHVECGLSCCTES
jgi:hypothetical protein